MVLVRKAKNNWHMYMNFTEFNTTCSKDPYPLPNIDCVIDGSSRYRMFNFMDTYSVYNMIRMDPMDTPKKTFMSNNGKYYYNAMPFGLKNTIFTYHQLMSAMFSHQIWHNLEVYVDDMIVKTIERRSHTEDLEDAL